MARQNDTLENCLYKLHVYIHKIIRIYIDDISSVPKRCANNMIKVHATIPICRTLLDWPWGRRWWYGLDESCQSREYSKAIYSDRC